MRTLCTKRTNLPDNGAPINIPMPYGNIASVMIPLLLYELLNTSFVTMFDSPYNADLRKPEA